MLAALMAAGTTSCIQDPEAIDEPKGEFVKVHLQINTPGGSAPVSRALSEVQENAVNNLTVLMFTADTHRLQALATPNKESQEGNTVKFTANFTIDGTLRNTPMEIIVLANLYGYDEATMKSWITDHISYENLQKQLQCSAGEITTDKLAERGIPMWGKSKETFIPTKLTNDANRHNIDMIRSVAKVDVIFKGAAINSIIPIKVHVIKPSSQMSLMPLWNKFTHGDGSTENPPRVTGISLPTIFGTDEMYAPLDKKEWNVDYKGRMPDTDLSLMNDIYLCEADVLKGADATPGDGNHTNRPAIIIEAIYGRDDTPTFYRVDFASGEAGTAGYRLCDVLRNHNFTVNVNNVFGRGHATLEEAYNSRVMYLQTNIVEWTNTNNNIVFDGETSIEMSNKTLYFTHAKGDIREVTINANVHNNADFDYTKWRMGWSFGAETFHTIDEGWFTVDGRAFEARIKPGATGNTATIQFRTKQVNGTVINSGEPFDKDAEQDVFYILVNKIRVNVRCVQCGKLPNDWEDGGDINGSI